MLLKTKKLAFFSLAILLACSDQPANDNRIPDFESNSSLSELFKDYKNIILDGDFSVVFYARPTASYGYKIFSLKGDTWTKIEVQQSVVDIEALKENPEYYEVREIIVKRKCRMEEANDFLSKLTLYNLFDLPNEEAIRGKCKYQSGTDATTIFLEIISGNKVRKLKYYDTFSLHEECPGVNELDNILKIKKLFEEGW